MTQYTLHKIPVTTCNHYLRYILIRYPANVANDKKIFQISMPKYLQRLKRRDLKQTKIHLGPFRHKERNNQIHPSLN